MVSEKPTDSSRTRRIGARVHESVFERLKVMANGDAKTVSEWCSERLTDIVRGIPVPFEVALLAEIAATQAILIDLIYTWSHDGQLTQKAVQEIVRSAQRSKFKEAGQLFLSATSRPRQTAASQPEETRPGESV
jgi:hypothetical protein